MKLTFVHPIPCKRAFSGRDPVLVMRSPGKVLFRLTRKLCRKSKVTSDNSDRLMTQRKQLLWRYAKHLDQRPVN